MNHFENKCTNGKSCPRKHINIKELLGYDQTNSHKSKYNTHNYTSKNTQKNNHNKNNGSNKTHNTKSVMCRYNDRPGGCNNPNCQFTHTNNNASNNSRTVQFHNGANNVHVIHNNNKITKIYYNKIVLRILTMLINTLTDNQGLLLRITIIVSVSNAK